MSLRTRQLYKSMDVVMPSRRALKKEAKEMKAFMVLIKRKLGRPYLPRRALFRKLMALIFDPQDYKD